MKRIILFLTMLMSISAFSQRDTRTVSDCGYSHIDPYDIPIPPASILLLPDEEFVSYSDHYDAAHNTWCYDWVIGCKQQLKTDYTWEYSLSPESVSNYTIQKQYSVFEECPKKRGCSFNHSDIVDAVAKFTACMSEKMDILVDPMSFNYSEMTSSGLPDMYCWCYLCRDLAGDPVYPLNVTSKIKMSDPALAEGCFDSYTDAKTDHDNQYYTLKFCHFISEDNEPSWTGGFGPLGEGHRWCYSIRGY